MGKTVKRVIVALCVATTLLLSFAAGTASAQGTTDWRIISTFIGADGEDVPLRVGTYDTPGRDGFGSRHIVDGHGAVPDAVDIEAALNGNCQYTSRDDKWRCSLRQGDRSVFVVFTERVDDGSDDGRPVGIITAYYSPRGCPC